VFRNFINTFSKHILLRIISVFPMHIAVYIDPEFDYLKVYIQQSRVKICIKIQFTG